MREGYGPAQDRWLAAAGAVAATQIALTVALPSQRWVVPMGFAALALLCAARTVADAPRADRSVRWRWLCAAISFLAWHVQWLANAALNTLLAGDARLASLMVVVSRTTIVVALMPLAPAEDRPASRALDLGLAAIFATLFGILSWPALLRGADGAPDAFYLYLGYLAMAGLAALAHASERWPAARTLIVAILCTHLVYATSSVAATEAYRRDWVSMQSPLLAVTDLAFVAYLFVIGRGAARRGREERRGTIDPMLPPQHLPLAITTFIVALSFAAFPAIGAWAIAAGLGALALYAGRASMAEERFRAQQHAALADARARATAAIDMMHEIRSPLGVISLNAGLIARGAAAGQDVEPLSRTIQRRCEAITRLLEDVLHLDRLEAKLVRVSAASVDVDAVVRQEMEIAHTRAAAFGIDLHAAPSGARVRGDPDALARILRNLVDNATRFTPREGKVRVHVERRGGEVRIVVSDTGGGIAPAAQARLFDRFCPSSHPVHGAKGTGLGLAISRNLARLMHGDLIVGATGAAGTDMAIVLPVGD